MLIPFTNSPSISEIHEQKYRRSTNKARSLSERMHLFLSDVNKAQAFNKKEKKEIHALALNFLTKDELPPLQSASNLPGNDLRTVIDKQVKVLSAMQVQLFTNPHLEISSEDFNNISEKIGELKEMMINCTSYTK